MELRTLYAATVLAMSDGFELADLIDLHGEWIGWADGGRWTFGIYESEPFSLDPYVQLANGYIARLDEHLTEASLPPLLECVASAYWMMNGYDPEECVNASGEWLATAPSISEIGIYTRQVSQRLAFVSALAQVRPQYTEAT